MTAAQIAQAKAYAEMLDVMAGTIAHAKQLAKVAAFLRAVAKPAPAPVPKIGA